MKKTKTYVTYKKTVKQGIFEGVSMPHNRKQLKVGKQTAMLFSKHARESIELFFKRTLDAHISIRNNLKTEVKIT